MKNLFTSFLVLSCLSSTYAQNYISLKPAILSESPSAIISDPGTITPPALGSGTRLMWIPAKSAFRVGTVVGSQWDAAKIGAWSFASGYNPTANGVVSTSLGSGTTANGLASTSIGYQTTANGDASTSIGSNTTAQAYSSVVLGRFNLLNNAYNPTTWIATDPLFVIGNSNDVNTPSNAMTVLKNGNVGIGTATPTNAKLHILGSSFCCGTPSTAELRLDQTSAYDFARLKFTNANSTSNAFFWDIAGLATPAGNEAYAALNFYYQNATNTGSNIVSMTGNGNVGIGTDFPNAPLQFRNAVLNRKVVLYEIANNDHQFLGLGINNSIFRYQVSSTFDAHVFYAATSATTSNELMRIQGNGKVGFSTPTLSLNNGEIVDINGRLRIRHTVISPSTANTAGVWFNNSANSTTFTDGAFHGMMNDNQTGIFIGGNWRFWVTSSGNATLLGTLTQSSDRRLKKNLSLLNNSLSDIYKINGYHYKWIEASRSQDLQTGLIAQEVQKIFPELVQTDEKGFLSVNYIGLIPHLIEAVKGLKDENINLKSENEILKSRLDKIEAILFVSNPSSGK